MFELTVIFAGLIFFSCTTLSWKYSAGKGSMTLLSWAVVGIGLIYGLGWILVLLATRDGQNARWERWILPFENLFLVQNLSVIFLIAGIWAGWQTTRRVRVWSSRFSSKRLDFSDEKALTYAWALFALAVLFQWIYVSAYGGLLEYLDYSALIRSSIFEVENKFGFLRPFAGLAFFSSYLFWGLWKGRKTRLIIWIGLAVSFSFSLYVLYSWLGRVGFVAYLSAFFLAQALWMGIAPARLMLGSILGGVILLFVLYGITNFLEIAEAGGFYSFVAKELSFPFGSFFAQLSLGEHLFRGFKDFLYAPVYFFPSSWWVDWIESVSDVNTIVIEGAKKGEQGVTGGIPVDLVTLGLMQASVFGVPVVGFLFGLMLSFLQGIVEGFRNPRVRLILLSYVSIKIAIVAIFYAHPAHVIVQNFDLIAFFLLLIVFSFFGRLRLK